MSVNAVPVMSIKKRPGGTVNKNKINWLLYTLFSRQEFGLCADYINKLMSTDDYEFPETPMYIKGLISRMSGNISESFDLLKKCHIHNEQNPEYLKQISRALFLMGKPKSALEVASEALKNHPYDWEIHHTKGLCYVSLKDYNSAIESFQTANSINKHETTVVQLAKVHLAKRDVNTAIKVLTDAVDGSLESSDILHTLGLLYLQIGQGPTAFQYLENCLAMDPKSEQAVLALGSAQQLKGDFDAALTKYKTLAVYNPNSGHIWNNIGMCFFGKQKYIAAVACLKKAFYLEPFEWSISYNLGIFHYTTEQYISAFHFFNNALNLKPDVTRSYMYLALSLHKLGDYNNCCLAFERGMKLESDPLLLLNYTMILVKEGDIEKGRKIFKIFEDKHKKNATKDSEIAHNYETLTTIFNMI